MIPLLNRLKSNSLFKDSFWAVLGSFISKGMIFIGTLIIARMLYSETYGEYGAIIGLVTSISIFSTIGLVQTSTKFISEIGLNNPLILSQVARKILIVTFKISFVFSILMFCFSKYISLYILNSTSLIFALKIISFWVVFNALTIVQIGILAGVKAYKSMAKINVFVGVFGFLTMVSLTYFYGLNGALTSLLATQIINCLFNFRIIKEYFPDIHKKHTLDVVLRRDLIKFTFPIAMQDSLFSLVTWMLTIIFLKLSNYNELGLYSASLQWSAVILLIPGILRNVILSHLSENSKNESSFNKILKNTLLLNFVATLLPLIIIYISMPLLLKFYGQSFYGLESVLKISLFSTLFVSCTTVFSQVFLAKGKNWLIFRMYLFRSVFLFFCIFFLINKNILTGAMAFVTSILLANILFLTLMLYFYFVKNK